jgi:hypothetical protein
MPTEADATVAGHIWPVARWQWTSPMPPLALRLRLARGEVRRWCRGGVR